MSVLGEKDLHGNTCPPALKGQLRKRFLYPPFTVMNAREGWWQSRKKAWLGLGIQSEVGRGGNVLDAPETTAHINFYQEKKKLEEELGKGLTTPEARDILVERGMVLEMKRGDKRFDSGEGRDGNLLGLSDSLEEYRQNTGRYTKDQIRAAKDAAPGGGGGPNSKYFAGSKAVRKAKEAQGPTASLKGGLTYGLTQNAYADPDKVKAKAAAEESAEEDALFGRGAFQSSEEKTASAADCGTSIFDPVLCELMYTWFCPPGGTIVDPFAGGSVRGIVAGMLGFRYWGSDLSARQIKANEAQNMDLLYGPTPRVEPFGRFHVVRDDRVPGGTKERALRTYLAEHPADTFVYATPAQGYAQIALARVCRELGKRAVLFVAARNTMHPRTRTAVSFGAEVHEVKPGHLVVVEARAREWAEENGAKLLPFGLHSRRFMDNLVEVIKTVPQPKEVWCAAGSGTLAMSLKQAWPDTAVHAVSVGRELKDEVKQSGVILHEYDLEYKQPARVTPPFPSCMEYDAKAWELMQEKGSDGALFWNVAADEQAVSWVCGDSAVTLDNAPDADMVFSCPPYADLEVYSKDPKDLSNMPYADFLEAYGTIIDKACQRLKDDRFACFVVGDLRDEAGIYRNFVAHTIRAFQRAGLRYYNEAILITAVGSLSIRVTRQFQISRKMGKTHQNVLVFVKGDPKKAASALVALPPAEEEE